MKPTPLMSCILLFLFAGKACWAQESPEIPVMQTTYMTRSDGQVDSGIMIFSEAIVLGERFGYRPVFPREQLLDDSRHGGTM